MNLFLQKLLKDLNKTTKLGKRNFPNDLPKLPEMPIICLKSNDRDVNVQNLTVLNFFGN